MSSRFTVDIDRLEQVAAQLVGLAGFFEDHLDGMDSRVASVLAGSWSGVSAEAFDAAKRQWVDAARAYVGSIRDAGDEMQRLRDLYAKAAELNGKML
ncbi:WXG100 family type VII secretion target [Nocardia asteroides]|uniref:WXG100 family type VII secretion target n=1 Tax=Nocardia asteroides TaxID=1824 RepID=UPI0037AFD874